MSLVAVLPALLASCDSIPEATPVAERPAATDGGAGVATLFEAKPLGLAISELLAKAANGKPVQALELSVHPHHVVLQAQNPEAPATVVQYEFHGGQVHGPVDVELRGKGTLDDNLFDLDEVALSAIPELGADAVERIDANDGKVREVIVRRNLPVSREVRMRIYVDSPARSGHVDAKANGELADD